MITIDIETTGLNFSSPEKEDFIVAIGIIDNFGLTIFSAKVSDFKSSLHQAERTLLSSFSNWLLDVEEKETIVSYNGTSFDVPFISAKLEKYGFTEANKKLLSLQHIDLLLFAKQILGVRISKDEACRRLGNIYVPKKTDGLWSARLYSNPQLLTEEAHMEMLQHNAIDTTSTYRLFHVLKNYPDFQEWLVSGGFDEFEKKE